MPRKKKTEDNTDLAVKAEEEWRPVVGFEGYYEVSNLGRVKTVARRMSNRGVPEKIRSQTELKGYHCVGLIKDGTHKTVKVHRIVAEAFIGSPPTPQHQVNHIDGDKGNNIVSNLEWATPQENTLHAHRTGLCQPITEERKEYFSRIQKERWADPAERARQSAVAHKCWDNEERRAERIQAITDGIHKSKAPRYRRNRNAVNC